jgi:hypothetical protein
MLLFFRIGKITVKLRPSLSTIQTDINHFQCLQLSIYHSNYLKLSFTLKSLISMWFLLFFLRNFSQLHALLEPPRLFISDKSATNTVFYVKGIKNPKSTHLRVYLILVFSPTYTLLKLHAYQKLQSITKMIKYVRSK